MHPHFDLIIIGCGGMGSSAAFYARQQGLKVLGIERFTPAHDRGSSHGHTRVIRKAYFEHPDYVPLLERAYSNWLGFEELSQEQLYVQTGLLEVGPQHGVLIQGVRQSAAQHRLPLEQIDRATFGERFPGFELPEDSVAVFEPSAGFLYVERCVAAYLAQAAKLGAEFQFGQQVLNWTANDQEVEVQTTSGVFRAARLIIAAGAWSSELMKDLGVELRILRKHLHWFADDLSSHIYQCERGAPTFFYETPAGYFYGFPAVDARGIKVAQHSGGEMIQDPLSVDRSVDVEERAAVQRFLQQHLPLANASRPSDHAVCMYTMSPDEHFILDRHPEFPQVAFVAGLSGHGFKFASVIGEQLVALATQGRGDMPMEFLSLKRFAI